MRIVTLMENSLPEGAACALTAEHGLSFYVETERHRLLMDTGASGKTFDNAFALGIDPAAVDTVVISHGHYDHADGLPRFSALNDRAAVYVSAKAGGDFYHGERYIGMDRAIAALPRVRWIGEEGKTALDSELSLFSGITGRELWPEGNRALSVKVEGALAQDDFSHEICLAIKSDAGYDLFSGCAHNGILNVLSRFRALYGCDPRRVFSGFHMMKDGGYTENETAAIIETAKRLSAMPTVFYTGHCTSPAAMALMAPIMKEKLIPLHAGMTIE